MIESRANQPSNYFQPNVGGKFPFNNTLSQNAIDKI